MATRPSPSSELHRLVTERSTGEFIAVDRATEVHLYLYGGRVAWGTTTDARFVFRRHVVEYFGVDGAALERVVQDCYRHRRALGEALVAAGLLTAQQVRVALAGQVRAALRSLRGCPGAEVMFLPRGASYGSYNAALTFQLEEFTTLHRPAPAEGPAPPPPWFSWQAIGTRVLRQVAQRVSRTAAGDAVLMVGTTLHTLNSTATFLWDQLDGVRTMEDLARALSGRFALTPEVAQEEVLQFIEHAIEERLVELVA